MKLKMRVCDYCADFFEFCYALTMNKFVLWPLSEIEQTIKETLNERPPIAANDIDNGFDTTKLATSPVPASKKRKIDAIPSMENVSKPKQPRPKKFKVEFTVQPSDYSFKDIGGNDKILINICRLLLHMKLSKTNETVRLPTSRGILLHGPPGVGKTLFAKAIAGVSIITDFLFKLR